MKDPFWVLFRLNLLIFFVNYFCLQKKLNSANNGNKRRNLMQIKILDHEVNLPLHKLYEKWSRLEKNHSYSWQFGMRIRLGIECSNLYSYLNCKKIPDFQFC